MKAKDMEYVILDVETTGLSVHNGDRIIEIALIRVRGQEIIEEFETFINPGRELPPESIRIHQITSDMLEKAPVSREVLPQVLDFIGGACLVGHNIKFDLDFLCYELSLICRKLRDETPALDTLKMAKELMAPLSNYRLSSLVQMLGLPVTDAHRALVDVKLTFEVFKRLLHLAQERRIIAFRDLVKDFGIQKPVCKFVEAEQDVLF